MLPSQSWHMFIARFPAKGTQLHQSMYLAGGKEHRSSLLFKEVHMPVSIIREHCNHIYLICQ